MGQAVAEMWSDPFGAAEFFCNDMILEEVAPGLVKVRMLCHEGGMTVLRCTLLLPAHVVLTNMSRTTDFLKSSLLAS